MAMRGGLLTPALFLVVILYTAHADTECNNPPPGVRKMVRGVDIAELDLVPLEISSTNGFKNPVINFTCNEGRVWQRDSEEFQLPDQVWHMTTSPGGWLATDVKLFKSYQDVRNKMTKDVGGEGNIWKFSFSASKSYSSMQHTISNTSRYISDTSSFDSASRVDLIPDWVLGLDSYAQGFIDRFIGERSYEDDADSYHRFIDYFGTHYFSTANFGGYIRVIEKTNTQYYYSHSDQETKKNAKAAFLKVLSTHGATVSGSTTVDSQFSSQSSETIKYYGGSTNLLTSGGIQSWQPTVDDDPWLFSGQLTPISDLFVNTIHKSGMQTAVLQHLLRSYLGELRRLLVAASNKVGGGPVIDSLGNRLTAMENLAVGHLVQTDVENLVQDIETQVKVPAWFTSNTQLCYKWWPDGDGGQCGAGESRLLCARPDSMTPVYRDDTDGRGGGCRMQWSIQSSGFESWFSQVQICYRWHPDGDGGQCGGGASRLLCASVNNYSPQYRDDTDGRGGGCQMSWRIVVPDSAPMWMKTAKMCFSWYPDGDGGQCGPAESRNMCATANSWTPYYRDDTDGRGGGCRLSWGIKLAI